MKKNLLLYLLACLLPAVCAAQLKMDAGGRTSLGPVYEAPTTGNIGTIDEATISPNSFEEPAIGIGEDADTLSILKIYGPYGDYRAGARITFGDNPYIYSLNVAVGEYGNTNTDQLWLHGANGFYLTKGTFSRSILASYTAANGNFVVSAPFAASRLYTYAQSTANATVTEVADHATALTRLASITPYVYTTAPTQITPMSASDGSSTIINSESYVFVASEVQALFPDLVTTDANGKQAIDYVSFIPLMLAKINEL